MPIQGLNLEDVAGVGGQIRVTGLGAVLGTIDTWNLKRREEAPSEATRWVLRGALSYVNEALLKLDVPLTVEIELKGKKYPLIFERPALTVSPNAGGPGGRITIEGCGIRVR